MAAKPTKKKPAPRRVRNGRVEVRVRSYKRKRPEKAWQRSSRQSQEWGW